MKRLSGWKHAVVRVVLGGIPPPLLSGCLVGPLTFPPCSQNFPLMRMLCHSAIVVPVEATVQGSVCRRMAGRARPALTGLSQGFMRAGSRHSIRPRGPPFVKTTMDSGRGWYKLYEEDGPEGFNKYRPPTPYDWEKSTEKAKRSKVFLEVLQDKDSLGKIVMELADEILPITSKNFRALCEGKQREAEGGSITVGYEGSTISRIIKESAIVAGELKGLGNHSAFEDQFFRDEGFFIPHSSAGLVSMVSAGVHRNGSLFYITTAPCPHLDGRAVAFGRVVQGMDVLERIAKIYTVRGRPVSEVTIAKSGVSK